MVSRSGFGPKIRRALPLALAGLGLFAAVAYGSAMLSSTPAQMVHSTASTVPAPDAVAVAQPLAAQAPAAQAPVNTVTQATQGVLNSTQSVPAVAPVTSGLSSAKPAQSGALNGVTGSLPTSGLTNNLPVGGLSSVTSALPLNASGLTGVTKSIPVVNSLSGLIP